ncbi:MAG: type II toxin-antitoxin system VapC family toxin [Anaerolineae bacterium]
MPERCVDASVAIKWVVRGEAWRKKARAFLRDCIAKGFTLVAPPMFEYETGSVLQRLLQSEMFTVKETDVALTRLAAIGMQTVTHPDMVRRARAIAQQFNQPNIYDALYAALAELRGCEFWTADKAFYEAVKAGLPFVKYLPDYP